MRGSVDAALINFIIIVTFSVLTSAYSYTLEQILRSCKRFATVFAPILFSLSQAFQIGLPVLHIKYPINFLTLTTRHFSPCGNQNCLL